MDDSDEKQRTGSAARLYQHFLIFYPASFRQRYGAEMVRVFSCDHLQAQHEKRVRAYWVGASKDLIVSASQERIAEGGNHMIQAWKNRQSLLFMGGACIQLVLILLQVVIRSDTFVVSALQYQWALQAAAIAIAIYCVALLHFLPMHTNFVGRLALITILLGLIFMSLGNSGMIWGVGISQLTCLDAHQCYVYAPGGIYRWLAMLVIGGYFLASISSLAYALSASIGNRKGHKWVRLGFGIAAFCFLGMVLSRLGLFPVELSSTIFSVVTCIGFFIIGHRLWTADSHVVVA